MESSKQMEQGRQKEDEPISQSKEDDFFLNLGCKNSTKW
jgi:hypothetical protein